MHKGNEIFFGSSQQSTETIPNGVTGVHALGLAEEDSSKEPGRVQILFHPMAEKTARN